MQCGVNITNLTATEFRPTKEGKIYSGTEIKKMNIQRDCCLKSFDASIDGKITGYLSSKVSYGSGGHQDNIFEEMEILAEWWLKNKKNTEDFLVILIYTDLNEKFTRIQKKYNKVHNIMVYNHYDFQNYLLLRKYIMPNRFYFLFTLKVLHNHYSIQEDCRSYK